MSLREWKPRPPSPELRNRIFGRPGAYGHAPAPGFPELWRWAVPALGCFMLVLSSLSNRLPHSHFTTLASTNFPRPVSLQESPLEVALLPQSRARYEQNSVPVTTVELRFAPASRLSQPEGLPRTNSLIQ